MSFHDVPQWAQGVAKSLLLAVKAKDPATFSHCVRVGHLSRLLAQASGLNDYEQILAEYSGLFHDVGKVGVPDHILLKPDRLTPEEMEKMKDHAQISADMLHPFAHDPFFLEMIPGVLHHHERFDGEGYPHKLGGEEIPLISRLILVVDTYDAMTADRAYRKGLPEEVAFKELKQYAGSQFDPQLVKIFLDAQRFWKRSGSSLRPAAASPRTQTEIVHRFLKAA